MVSSYNFPFLSPDLHERSPGSSSNADTAAEACIHNEVGFFFPHSLQSGRELLNDVTKALQMERATAELQRRLPLVLSIEE